MKHSIALLALFALTAAHAHTALETTLPADGAAVQAPVRELVLDFAGDVRLTAVSLTNAAGASKGIAPPPASIAASFTLAVHEVLEPGEYVVTWRAVGGDTHIVSGEFGFTVDARASD